MIRPARTSDFPAILGLNEASVHFLSPLDQGALHRLDAAAAYHRVVDDGSGVSAFLLALPEGVDYASLNYRWFAEHHEIFLYVDRIVVAEEARGAGLGRRLYDDLIAWAGLAGIPRITCEFDLDPPNPGSERFHASFGFEEVGRQTLPGGKVVSLQALEL